MPYKLQTLVNKISDIPSATNARLVGEFDSYLRDIGRKDRYRKNQLLSLIPFCHYLAKKYSQGLRLIDLIDHKVIRCMECEKVLGVVPASAEGEALVALISPHKQESGHEKVLEEGGRRILTTFLDGKIKSKEDDPDERWRVTWNAYLDCIKYFYRYLESQHGKQEDVPTHLWQTPAFVQIRRKQVVHETYDNEEIWDDPADVLLIAKYALLPDKVLITFIWDCNGRPDEVAKTAWRHLVLRETYGEGEIPADTKTGTRPLLLMLSFTYIRDWKNQYPFPYHERARIVCNTYTGAPVTSDTIYKRFIAVKTRIEKMIANDEIKDTAERQRLQYLLQTKAWNPYCFRHSSIDYDMGELPEFAVRKKVGWTLTSKQPARYGKRRMNQNIKVQLLASRAGVILEEDGKPKKPTTKTCPYCQLVNSVDIKHCSRCGRPLSFEALEEAKAKEKSVAEAAVLDVLNEHPEILKKMMEQFEETRQAREKASE